MEKKIITIACVGDSITCGLTIDEPEVNSYPNQLQHLLGPQYVVNPSLGRCGAGIWHRGSPYTSTQEYIDAVRWNSDILVICLGTNDAIYPINDDFKKEFKEDYKSLVQQLTKNCPKKEVFICLVPPVFELKNMTVSISAINSIIKDVAEQCNYNLIDLYTPFISRDELFSDGIHPNENGSGLIAEIIYQEIIKLNKDE